MTDNAHYVSSHHGRGSRFVAAGRDRPSPCEDVGVTSVGTPSTRLVILRGDAASGKTTTALALRGRLSSKVALIHQDYFRRELLSNGRQAAAIPGRQYSHRRRRSTSAESRTRRDPGWNLPSARLLDAVRASVPGPLRTDPDLPVRRGTGGNHTASRCTTAVAEIRRGEDPGVVRRVAAPPLVRRNARRQRRLHVGSRVSDPLRPRPPRLAVPADRELAIRSEASRRRTTPRRARRRG